MKKLNKIFNAASKLTVIMGVSYAGIMTAYTVAVLTLSNINATAGAAVLGAGVVLTGYLNYELANALFKPAATPAK